MKITIKKEPKRVCLLWFNVSNLRDIGAKMKTVMMLFGLVALLTACGVKDPIYNTPHPGHAMVTLTTEWSGIGEGLTAPESYMVTAALNGSASAGYSAVLSGVTNKLDHLFEPGNYRFYVYNTPEHITINGTVATVEQAAVTPMNSGGTTASASAALTPVNAAGTLVQSAPGWLFTCALDAALAADTELALTAPMQQQVRQLTLIIEPTGSTKDKIESITGTLSGVAGKFDMASGTYGTPSHVALNFSKISTGSNAGKWSATVRLLGVTGAEQKLTGKIAFTGGNPTPIPLDSNLTTQLATFNADKRTPLSIDGTVVKTPGGAGFEATITDWTLGNGNGEDIDANI